MTRHLPLRSLEVADVQNLENKVKIAEGLSSKIDSALETNHSHKGRLQEHEDILHKICNDIETFQIKIKEEEIVKPVYIVKEDNQEIEKPVFHVYETDIEIEKPVFHVEEKHSTVIKENIEEITKIHNINKNVVYLTIGLLGFNLTLTILEIVLWIMK